MNPNASYKPMLPFHLHHLTDKLSTKMKDDALMYDILAISKQTIIVYFLEPNETTGGVGLFTEENVPDSVFSSGTLIGSVEINHENEKAVFPRIFVTIPFAEKEENHLFQNPPRMTKYPIVTKAILQKGVQDLKKTGINKVVNIDKISNDLFDKYNNVSLIEDVLAVDSKRQNKIDQDIKNRTEKHRHIQLHYNNINLKPLKNENYKGELNAVIAMHWLEHGGAEKFAVMSMEKAKEMGYNVYCIIDKRGNKNYLKQVRSNCKNIFNIAEGLPTEYWGRFYINLCQYLNVRLFHIHHAISAYQALPKIKTMTNVKVILDTTHIIEHSDGGYVRVSGVFSQYLNYHHTISQELNDYLTSQIHVPHHKIKLGYLFNEANLLSIDDKKFDKLDNNCVITFVGRLVNQKRPYIYIELVNKILSNPNLKNRKFTFNMVGEGPLEDICEQIVKQKRLDGKINFLPANTDIKELFERSHFLIIPSENEGLTLVAYEAILENCIVISTDVGSQREIVAPKALLSRKPEKFIDDSIKLIQQSLDDIKFVKNLLQEQYSQITAITQKNNWEQTLENIYMEAKND